MLKIQVHFRVSRNFNVSLYFYVNLYFSVSPEAIVSILSETFGRVQDLSLICGVTDGEECCELPNALVCTNTLLGGGEKIDLSSKHVAILPLSPPKRESIRQPQEFSRTEKVEYNFKNSNRLFDRSEFMKNFRNSFSTFTSTNVFDDNYQKRFENRHYPLNKRLISTFKTTVKRPSVTSGGCSQNCT